MDDKDTYERWIRGPRPVHAPGVRLICFPHAVGAASFYRHWAGLLGPRVEQLIVQYPGREDRIGEPCVTGMDEMAGRVTEAITPALGRPVALFGHSMGAAIACEVARRLEARGQADLRWLFVSARRVTVQPPATAVHLLDDEGVLSHLRSLGGTDEMVFAAPELRSLILRLARCDYRLIETYRPAGVMPLTAPILAAGGSDDPHATPEDMKQWAGLTTGEFVHKTFDGGHFYLRGGLNELVREIAGRLEASSSATEPRTAPATGQGKESW